MKIPKINLQRKRESQILAGAIEKVFRLCLHYVLSWRSARFQLIQEALAWPIVL